jgi:hypothetical protein
MQNVFTALVALVLAGGCQHQRYREAYLIDAFTAEARVLEDKIYELHARVEDLESQLAGRPAPRRSRPAESELPDSEPSPARPSPSDSEDEPDLTPPEVEPGTPTEPDELQQDAPVPAVPSAHARRSPQPPRDRTITSISLGPRTRSANFDDAAGDDGLWVVVEPRNRQGELVPAPGKVTVVILDAIERTHFGRWEFDTATATNALRQNGMERGILLQLRWEDPPPNPELQVFARYETADGRRLEADVPVTAKLANHVAEGWTPRSSNPATRTGSPHVARQPQSASPPSDEAQGPPPEVYR